MPPKKSIRACSSAGRAFGSHPRGREFESLQVHQNVRNFLILLGISELFCFLKLGTLNSCDFAAVRFASHTKSLKILKGNAKFNLQPIIPVHIDGFDIPAMPLFRSYGTHLSCSLCLGRGTAGTMRRRKAFSAT